MPPVDSVTVHRPRRWDEPMDPHMTDADVDWLLARMPFAGLDASQFPKSIPLDGVLKNDCRLHRFSPGQVIVREGDYANSAFLVLEGNAELITRPLPPDVLGRREVEKRSWPEALWQFLRPSGVRESRSPEDVTPDVELHDRPGTDHLPAASSDKSNHSGGEAETQPTLFLQDFGGLVRAGQTARLVAGELFGEVATMLRGPHGATVVAGENATLLEIRLQGLKMLQRDTAFAERMEEHYREHWLAIHLKEIPLLRFVPESNLRNVVEHTQLRSFGRLQWNADYSKTRKLSPAEQIESEPIVAREGHHVTDLIIVRSGFGRVCQNYGSAQRTTAYLGKGHVFGLEEITLSVTGGNGSPMPLQHSLRAVGFLDTLHIPVECFAREVLPHIRRSELPPNAAEAMLHSPSTAKSRERRALKRARSDSDLVSSVSGNEEASGTNVQAKAWDDLPSPTGTSFEPTGLLEFIVQNRYNNGRQAMIIDLHRCTRCDDCVKACADVHDGNPRFARVGNHHERLQFVEACMHCTDPVCMIGCPTGALHRDEATGLVRISENICIGCGVCAKGCPYDNIEMVAVSDPKGRPFLDVKSKQPITKATKCDMCSGLPSGPACAAACPHDALVRIDLSESPPLEDWLRRRT
ncbi:4Fe-4S dicluster domain-containing protein [Rhodopirellula sp. SWK7]|uniref:4Fe-4S dicluster domain-containing protein n=1 Tax=Rhodopirellula sp. SWK7 TaxID=595460 RepID=UPI0002BFB21C|nr:4Fe-4S dicluster domain-containing protein [Rhodopirellula sp. SWK7]EMI40772.1 cyclic nucleotide-binding protein [Rhodopirellula sp. SWK7]